MYHDPTLAGASTARLASNQGWLTKFAGLLVGRKPVPPAIEPSSMEDEGPSIERLACVLAELIATAQSRVDGAVAVVGRSADEAQAYRHALADEARSFDPTGLPVSVATTLIDITRSMIDRAREAEGRLRKMGADLETLRTDLQEARECAERDPLTGLPNRRALEAAMTRAIESARVADQALSLAFCDIDQFKILNDRHGHALGDRVLRRVADTLSDGAGEGVFVGRQGGEEFIMLFEGVGAEQAAIKVDAIRQQLASRMIRSRTDETPIGVVTFSAGIAMLAPNELADDLLRRADRALYHAKRSGRNRVEIDRGD